MHLCSHCARQFAHEENSITSNLSQIAHSTHCQMAKKKIRKKKWKEIYFATCVLSIVYIFNAHNHSLLLDNLYIISVLSDCICHLPLLFYVVDFTYVLNKRRSYAQFHHKRYRYYLQYHPFTTTTTTTVATTTTTTIS